MSVKTIAFVVMASMMLTIGATVAVCQSTTDATASQTVAINELPNDPLPAAAEYSSSTAGTMPDGMFLSRPPAPPIIRNKETKVDKIEWRVSEVFLFGDLARDMKVTYDMVTHKRNATYNITCADINKTTLVPGWDCEPADTVIKMNVALFDPYFTEGGFGKMFGNRNAPGIIAWNIGFDLGVWTTAKLLYRHGGKSRKAAIIINTWKGIDHLVAAHGVVKSDRQTVDEFIPSGAMNAAWY
jgi:hypothetical protein